MKKESKQNTKPNQSTQSSSKAKTTMELLIENGITIGTKTGAILMPLSKMQKKSMKK